MKEKPDRRRKKNPAIEKNLSAMDPQIKPLLRPREEPGSRFPAVRKIPAACCRRALRFDPNARPYA